MQLTLTESISRLNFEKDDVTLEVKRLKAHLESEVGPSSENLKTIIQEMRNQKSLADQEVLSLKHELTVMTMEKEKYEAILSVRDMQIKEIKSEMDLLQNTIKEQVMDMQNSQSSSTTNFTADPSSWSLLHNKPKQAGDSPKGYDYGNTDINNKEINFREINYRDNTKQNNPETYQHILLNQKGSSLRELPSGDSSGTSSVLHEMHKNGTINNVSDPTELYLHKPIRSKVS